MRVCHSAVPRASRRANQWGAGREDRAGDQAGNLCAFRRAVRGVARFGATIRARMTRTVGVRVGLLGGALILLWRDVRVGVLGGIWVGLKGGFLVRESVCG